MTTSDSLIMLVGEPTCHVWPLDHYDADDVAEVDPPPPGDGGGDDMFFKISIDAIFSLPQDGAIPRAMSSATAVIPCPALTADAMVLALTNVDIPAELLRSDLAYIVNGILDCSHLIADRQRGRRRTVQMTVFVDIIVDRLPQRFHADGNNNDNEVIRYVPESDEFVMGLERVRVSEDADELIRSALEYREFVLELDTVMALEDADEEIRFVPASNDAITGLERVRVSSSDVACPVCLEEIPVGSEVTRLPCSHCFHGDCIVKWLCNSKFCPLCRFEMPS